MKKLLFLLLFIAQIGTAQSSMVSEIIDEIDMKEDKIQAAYEWVTDNIKYDVEKRNELHEGKSSAKNAAFKTEAEFHAHLLKNVIDRKKGVCQDYSILFDAIVSELGYESHIVKGYTKNIRGSINRKIGHTWNAVKVNGAWKLYDPTWGAGYVEDEKKFVKRYNEKWYDVPAVEMIEDHMPFDYIWQFVPTPVSYAAFESSKHAVAKSTLESSNTTVIDAFLKKGKKEQMEDQLKRSLELGDGIRLIERHRKLLTKNISLYDMRSQPNLMKDLTVKSNNSIKLFNSYINAKNTKFKNKKWTIPFAKKTLVDAKQQMTDVVAGYKSLEIKDKRALSQIHKTIRYSEKFLKQVDVEMAFMETLK